MSGLQMKKQTGIGIMSPYLFSLISSTKTLGAVTGQLFAVGERIAEWTAHQFPRLDAKELSVAMQVAEAYLGAKFFTGRMSALRHLTRPSLG
jgi:hypothetical protein